MTGLTGPCSVGAGGSGGSGTAAPDSILAVWPWPALASLGTASAGDPVGFLAGTLATGWGAIGRMEGEALTDRVRFGLSDFSASSGDSTS